MHTHMHTCTHACIDTCTHAHTHAYTGGSDMLGTRRTSGESKALEMWKDYRTMGQTTFAAEYLWPDSRVGLEQV